MRDGREACRENSEQFVTKLRGSPTHVHERTGSYVRDGFPPPGQDYLKGTAGITRARGILALLLLAFVIRLAVVVTAIWLNEDYSAFSSVDTGRYVFLAKSLMRGEFSLNGVPWRPEQRWDIPEIFRTPGYPVFLLVGLFAGHLELITIFLQVALSCLTVYLVYRLAIELFDDELTGLFCALFYAIEPLSVFYTAQLLTETLFTATTVLFVWYFVKLMRTGEYLYAVIAALFVAAATYVRPGAYFLPLLGTIVVLGGWLFKKSSGRSVLPAVVFLVLSTCLVAPWQVRNYQRSNFFWFSSVPATVSYWDYRPAIVAMVRNIPLDQEKENQRHTWDARSIGQLTQLEQYDYMKREAADILLSHPLESIKFLLGRLFGTLLNPGANNYLSLLGVGEVSQEIINSHIGPGSVARGDGAVNSRIALLRDMPFIAVVSYGLLGCLLLVTYVLAILGLSSKAVIGRIETIMILGVVCYLLLSTSPVGYSRFRHPVMPFICIFAGYGLRQVFQIWHRLRN